MKKLLQSNGLCGATPFLSQPETLALVRSVTEQKLVTYHLTEHRLFLVPESRVLGAGEIRMRGYGGPVKSSPVSRLIYPRDEGKCVSPLLTPGIGAQ